MPTGKGIYEDEPREHRKTYTHDPAKDHDDPTTEDPTPDDASSKDASEATG